jgi:hypothetical protein
MKKTFIAIFCILSLVSLSVKSQTTFPNPDFEIWADTANAYGWDCSNIDTTYMGFPVKIFTAVQDSLNEHGGSYCMKLKSKNVGFGMPTNPGFTTLGTFWFTISPQAGGAIGGIPFSGKPDTLKGWYKATPQGNDLPTVFMEIWQGAHATIIQRDTMLLPAAASYTQFAMKLNYSSTANPDSMNIVISSSKLYTQADIAANSLMYIDDLELVYGNTSILGINYTKEFNVYADAATNNLIVNLSLEMPEMTTISMYNTAGQLVYRTRKNIGQSAETIGLDGFEKGIYIVDVRTDKGKHFSQKISLN